MRIPVPREFLSAALLLLASIASAPASASFHLFSMSELYSNGDGSVQFLEITALTGSQQFVGGHTLRVQQGTDTHSFTFPSNLPGDTSGKAMLIATQGFADLHVVTPDYVVPNGFFFAGNGTITYAEGSDIWSYSGLPSDGTMALNRGGSTATNSARNFAGDTGSVSASSAPPPPPPSSSLDVEGLWWKSPAGSESGWGVNVTHQGDILFATWFTYDLDGSGMWLVMPDGTKTGTNAYSGALYRTTGPSFDSATFDPSKVVATQVGTASFSFSDANTGTFSYTVNGISQSKAITRQVFGNPTPTCFEGAASSGTTFNYGTGTAAGPNYQDLWWRAPAGSESGWGVNVSHQGNILFATWFTYDSTGKGLWLVVPDAERVGTTGTFSGALYRTTGPAFNASPWNPGQVVATQVGTASFSFDDANTGTFTYTVNGITQSKPITRQVFGTPTTVCQ